jgi:tetratricopeptide (TPR) repeat protein
VSQKITIHPSLRIAASVVAIVCCLLLMQAAARFGFARLLGRYAVFANSLPAADQAIALAPADAEAHRARARVLSSLQMPDEARKSFETATSLRYQDDYLWLELGSTRDEAGDDAAALAAFDQAVRWAPYYAHTHWERGNLRLRMGQYAGAIDDLRTAAASEKSLLPNFIDLAWGLARGDVNTVEQLVQVNDDRDRLALGRFLAQKGQGKECLKHVSLLRAPLSDENRRDLVSKLIAAKAFSDAFELWRTDQTQRMPVVVNGGFEQPLLLTNQGFGWNVGGKPEPRIVIDDAEKSSGAKSLLVQFGGEWKDTNTLLSQTIVVEPAKRYRISFGIKTKEIVTGAPPIIAVTDAGNHQRLGHSAVFPTPSSNWQTMTFEFTAMPSTQAVLLEFTRVRDACNPCPIFGTLWLDDLLIEDIGSADSQR